MADTPPSSTADASLPGASRFNDSRASVDSTRDGVGANYDRIRVPSELRENILSGINDSSTSLDYYDDEEDEDATTSGAPSGSGGKAVPTAGNYVAGGALSTSPAAPQGKKQTSKMFGGASSGSRLKESVQSSDLETPRAEVKDPLAQKGAQIDGGVSPMSSPTTATNPSGGMLGDDLGTESGRTMSKVSTREDENVTEVVGGEAPKRPGTMRRLTSRIKKTISSKG